MSGFHFLNFKSFVSTFKSAFKHPYTDPIMVTELFFAAGLNYEVKPSTISKILNDSSKIPQKIFDELIEIDAETLEAKFKDSFDKYLDPMSLTMAKDKIVNMIESDTTISKTIKETLLSKGKKEGFTNEIYFMACVFLYVIRSKEIIAKQSTDNDIKSVVDHGIIGAYHNVAEIPYTQLIKNSNSYIDIVHIHGDSWIKSTDKGDLFREKMKNPNITIRLLLLSPKSPFFTACDEFIPTYSREEKTMLFKLKSSLRSWDRSYAEATQNRTRPGAKFYVYLTQQFPTKNICRFDNILVANSKYMGKARVGYLPTICCESRANEENFFKFYMQEIDALINESDICFDATTTSLEFLISQL